MTRDEIYVGAGYTFPGIWPKDRYAIIDHVDSTCRLIVSRTNEPEVFYSADTNALLSYPCVAVDLENFL